MHKCKMINILSYVGMSMHSEVCLWTLLGLVRSIFDATLFKVNANLKQVWQMAMPDDLSMPVQRALRTMISGVMLVQCFTVYVYLASYIVLLYPVFLEERPTLVLPWLLLAATRKLLCELTSLALGLGTCVLLGPARPPCIKFVIVKLVSIMPAFYVWMLVLGYYHALKVATAFKTFTTVLPPSDHDYGLELAIRRRKTKSLLGEDQLRTNIVASLYGERPCNSESKSHTIMNISSRIDNSPSPSLEDLKTNGDIMLTPASVISNGLSETGSYEDWHGNDVVVPRNTDRILEQFVLMMLRMGAYLRKEGISYIDLDTIRRKSSHTVLPRHDSHKCTTMPSDDTDTPPIVGSSRGNTASYVREYPQIFMKKPSDIPRSSEHKMSAVKTVHSHIENDDNSHVNKTRKRSVSISPNEKVDIERTVNKRTILPESKNPQQNKHRESESHRKFDIERTVNKRTILPESKNPQQSKHRESENHRKLSTTTVSPETKNTREKSNERNQNSVKYVSRVKIKPELDLDKILTSSDSLRSIIENVNRIAKNKNNSEENEEATSSASQKHEKKD